MKKHTFNIFALINHIKLDPRVEKEMDELQPQILANLHQRIETDSTARQHRRHIYWRVAAASVALIVLAGIFTTLNYNGSISNTTVEYASLAGERCSITLPDGTVIEMNGNSRLSYDSHSFGKAAREIYFSGEAFFDVAKNREAPFTVHNGDLDITVLGTRFNVDGYLAESKTKVTLESGKVDVSVNGCAQSLILEPGQQSIFIKDENRLVRREVNVKDVTSWLSGGLFFDDESLDEIARRLEAHYGVTININTSRFDTNRYNGAFSPGDGLDCIFTFLSRMDNRLQYQTKGDTINIYASAQAIK